MILRDYNTVNLTTFNSKFRILGISNLIKHCRVFDECLYAEIDQKFLVLQLLTDNQPLLNASTVPNMATGGAFNTNTLVIPAAQKSNTPGPSSNQTITLSDGSTMQVAKFSGKSNDNDISKLTSQ